MTQPLRGPHGADRHGVARPVDGPDLARRIADGTVMFELVDEDLDERRDAIRDWGMLLRPGYPAPRHWALVDSAIRNADNILTAATGSEDPTRGGPWWCQLALDTYHVLQTQGAYAHIPETPSGVCLADSAAVRTWLAAPTPGGPAQLTVGDVLDLTADFTGEASLSTAAVDRLLATAQEAGVFGVADHRIELHLRYATGNVGAALALVTRPVFGYLVDLDEPPGRPAQPHTRLDLGPASASARVQISDLLPTGVTGTDAAVTLLTRAADLITTALAPSAYRAAAHALADPVTEQPVPARARRAAPFPPLHLAPTPSAAATTSAADPPPGRRSRR
jgi:hypothetical protein